MKCILSKTNAVLAPKTQRADTFWSRLKGLMFLPALPPGQALLLEPCPQIHTCFMRFAIDVVFLDHHNRAVAVLEHFKPWRVSHFYSRCRRTLELPAGTLNGRVQPGDELIFENEGSL